MLEIDISVLLSTFRRPSTLGKTLEAMTNLDHSGLRWEIVVVDNADDEPTQRLLKEWAPQLPLSWTVCSTQGKSFALNQGLKLVRGNIIAFTDDDIIPDPHWLKAIVAGAKRYPQASLFGGRIFPKWPGPIPAVIEKCQDLWIVAYGYHNPVLSPGLQSAERFCPNGSNFAVTRKVVEDGFFFRTDFGPVQGAYQMGEDTEFVQRVLSKGHHGAFLPSSLVYHQIRFEQLDTEWLAKRFQQSGMGLYHLYRGSLEQVFTVAGFPGVVLWQMGKMAVSYWIHRILGIPEMALRARCKYMEFQGMAIAFKQSMGKPLIQRQC